jgi:hypothetical protein
MMGNRRKVEGGRGLIASFVVTRTTTLTELVYGYTAIPRLRKENKDSHSSLTVPKGTLCNDYCKRAQFSVTDFSAYVSQDVLHFK